MRLEYPFHRDHKDQDACHSKRRVGNDLQERGIVFQVHEIDRDQARLHKREGKQQNDHRRLRHANHRYADFDRCQNSECGEDLQIRFCMIRMSLFYRHRSLLDEVHKGEENDPDQIDKVPIQTGDLHNISRILAAAKKTDTANHGIRQGTGHQRDQHMR